MTHKGMIRRYCESQPDFVAFTVHRAILVIALMLSLCFPTLVSADADKIFKENSKAVVVVVAYDKQGKAISQGSGFIVRQDDAVVTNL